MFAYRTCRLPWPGADVGDRARDMWITRKP